MHTCDSVGGEAEAEQPPAQGHVELHSETLAQKQRKEITSCKGPFV